MRQARIRRTLVCVLCVAVLLFSGTVLANDEYDAAMAHAIAVKEKALDSNLPEDWEATLSQLGIVDSIRSTADSKYEMAVAASKLQQVDVAVENYVTALQIGLPVRAADKARTYVMLHATQLAQIRIEGADGTRILLRGVERARLPHAKFILVMPGSVALEGITESDGHIMRALTLAPGQVASISLLSQQPEEMPSLLPKDGAMLGDAPELDSGASSSPRRQHKVKIPRLLSDANSSLDQSFFEKRMGRALIAAGTTASIVSAAYIAISNSRLSDGRSALLDRCAVQLSGPDSCAHAKIGQYTAAQSASNVIARWKTVRVTSWVGFIAGMTAVIGGTTLLLDAKSDATASMAQLSLQREGLEFWYNGIF